MNFFALILLFAATHARKYYDTTVSELVNDECSKRFVCVRGIIVDAFPDETDKRYYHLVLYDNGDLLDLATYRHLNNWDKIRSLVNSPVSVRGRVQRVSEGLRKHTNPFLIDTTTGMKFTPTNAPAGSVTRDLGNTDGLGSNAIRRLGLCRAKGIVRAIWQTSWVLVQTEHGQPLKIRLAYGLPLPAIGEPICVTGVAGTDSVDVLFTHAHWESADATIPPASSKTTDLSAKSLTAKSGTMIKAAGILRHKIKGDPDAMGAVILDCHGVTAEIDPGPCTGLFDSIPLDSVLEVTGCLVLTIRQDSLRRPFSSFKGFKVVIRTPDDVRIIASPSWWTPLRLTVIIVILLVIVIAAGIWNRMLKQTIAKRSRELADEQLANSEADLRFSERNNLAIELHDSLSQTLTGAAMEIQAAGMTQGDLPADTRAHLESAGSALQSCRDELRNCIWDLRSKTLDYSDMTEAILRAVEPHVSDSRLTVRFNVPRQELTDSAAHAILCAVRELVLNAFRHGHAQSIKVAGCLDGQTISFSVTDDGIGFDPKSAPGVLQGHFGLQGIRERLRKLNGTFVIDSSPGKGTKATATLQLAPETD